MNQLLFGHLFRLAISFLLVTMATAQDHPPDKSAASQEPAPSGTSKKETSSSADQVVFRDAQGRELKAKDLAGVTGAINWSIAGSENVTQHARELHELGQEEGSAGHADKAQIGRASCRERV